MQRLTLREMNPELYAQLQEEQKQLREEVLPVTMLARICPNCLHVLERLPRGVHGKAIMKCPVCKEETVFPTLFYRRTKNT